MLMQNAYMNMPRNELRGVLSHQDMDHGEKFLGKGKLYG